MKADRTIALMSMTTAIALPRRPVSFGFFTWTGAFFFGSS